MPRGTRPDPSTYMSQGQIQGHLSNFEGGVTKISAQTPTGQVGPPGGTFVMPRATADNLISQAGGDIHRLEASLGLPRGSLGSNPVRIDIPNPQGLRMPSRNEFGANSQWIPGGFTSGGIMEATINPAQPGTFAVTPIH